MNAFKYRFGPLFFWFSDLPIRVDIHALKQSALGVSLPLIFSAAAAISLGDLSNKDATVGVKTVLEKGADVAVSKLGVENGFLNNDKVNIALPGPLEKAMPLLRMTGKGQKTDDLVVSTVALAKPMLLNAVKSMSVSDAKNILAGGDTSVIDFFRQKTSQPLTGQFLQVVKKITDRNRLSSQYKAVVGQVAKSGLASSLTSGP